MSRGRRPRWGLLRVPDNTAFLDGPFWPGFNLGQHSEKPTNDPTHQLPPTITRGLKVGTEKEYIFFLADIKSNM